MALSYGGGMFDRWAYGRVPGRLVGAGRSFAAFPPARDAARPVVAVKMCASQEVRGTVRAPEGTDLSCVRVRVQAMRVLHGRYGSAVPRLPELAGLEATLPEIFESAVNADGTFTLGDVPSRVVLHLGADGPGLARAGYTNSLSDDWDKLPDPVTFKMKPEVVVTGVLRAPDRTPITGARVEARMRTVLGFPRVSFAATTDERGRFRIGGLPTATFDVTVDAGSRPWRMRPLAPFALGTLPLATTSAAATSADRTGYRTTLS